jgi:apolipoprotein N-acyltransferase
MGDAVATRAATRSSSFLLPLISGVLLALSFPKYGGPAFSWFALTPLLVHLAAVAVGPRRSARAFRAGLLCGFAYFAGTVYWTSGVMAQYGGIASPVAMAIAALLVAFLALFPAFFALIQTSIVARYGTAGLLLAPAIWVATELGRTWLFGGFPWALLGYSQTRVLPIAQFASVAGVYGLSALVALVSASVAVAILRTDRTRWLAAVTAAVAVAACYVWGAARLADGRLVRGSKTVRVGLVQGNVPQDVKWEPAFAGDILLRYLSATRRAAERGAALVIWPESSTPFYYQRSPQAEAVRQLAREKNIWILLGSDELDPVERTVSYNSAFLVRPAGTTAGIYRKVQLVPFGEYVPFRRLLFFAKPLVQAVSDFAPGTAPVMLPFAGGAISTAICYEVVYPALIVRTVSALRHGGHAGHRARPIPGPFGEHRYQRYRRSVRARDHDVRFVYAAGACGRRSLDRGVDPLCPCRRRRGVRVRARDRGRSRGIMVDAACGATRARCRARMISTR